MRDVSYRKAYILPGDLGAHRKEGCNAQKTGERLGFEKVKGKTYLWTVDQITSCYQLTTGADRFLPDVVPLAQYVDGRMDLNRQVPNDF